MLRRWPALAVALLVISVVLSARQDRAAEIIARAREAIGGEARLRAVHSLSLKGVARTTGRLLYKTRDYAFIGTDDKRRGDVRVDLLLPGKFVIVRTIMTSERFTGVNDDHLIAGVMSLGRFRPDTFIGINGPSGEPRALQANQREFLRYLVAWLLVAPEERRLQFSDAGEVQTPDGVADAVDAFGAYDFTARLLFDRQSHRLSMVTFQEPPAPTRFVAPPPSPTIVQREDTPLRKVIETGDGTATFLFDKSSHQLVNLTFQPTNAARSAVPRPAPPPNEGSPDQPLFRSIEGPDVGVRGTVTTSGVVRAVAAKYVRRTTIRLGDYRPVDGISLPHRVAIDTGPVEEWEISSFKVNPTIDAKRFAPK